VRRRLHRPIFYTQALERVRALPGVVSLAASINTAARGDQWGGWNFIIEGRPAPRPGESPGGVYRIVMARYFETMRRPPSRTFY